MSVDQSIDIHASKFFDRVKSQFKKEKDLPDLFTYFITDELNEEAATVEDIRNCYRACDLVPPSWLASHFSNGLKNRFGPKGARRFIRGHGGWGYRLEARRREEIKTLLGLNGSPIEITTALGRLENDIAAGPKRDFLHETIKCFNATAYRAAVVMCWNLAMHHLQDHILANPAAYTEFNAALARNTDSRVKIKSVTKQDDFTEISESKFLLFCREAKIITSSMFNKLESRLHERNSAAHPSGVKIVPKAAEAYIDDLVENVLKKYLVS
jgi:hypothetical protein